MAFLDMINNDDGVILEAHKAIKTSLSYDLNKLWKFSSW